MDQAPCGSAFRNKRKKAARSVFDRRKNAERRRQQAHKENLLIEVDEAEATATTPTLESIVSNLTSITLPEYWQAFPGTHDIQFSKVEIALDGLRELTASVLINSNLSWSIHVISKQVPATCKLLTEFPLTLSSPTTITNLLSCIHHAAICPGNPDVDFIDLCQKHGGTIKGARGNGDTIAFLDHKPVINSDGQSHPCSVRRVDCEVICEPTDPYPLRCQVCQSFRPTLRAIRSRVRRDDPTTISSHTNYIHLTSSEKNERMKNLHKSYKIAKQQVRRLELKVKQLIINEGISLQPCDTADISQIVEDVTPVVEQNFPQDSPQRVFWDQQRMYNRLTSKREMKWHPLVLRFALNLKYMSTSAYRAVRQSGIINLPSERTLSDYTHWASAHSGLQLEFVEELHSMLSADVPSHQCAISMDEMKIKSCLVFSKHSGTLVGFVDLGSVNHDIEKVMSGEQDECTSKKLASHAFVIMARAVFKPSLCVPVAHYFSSNLKGKQK